MAEIKAVNAMRRQQARAKKEKKIKEQKKIERRKELEDIMASVARKDLTPYEREKRHRRDMAWRIQTFAARPTIQVR